MVTMLPEPQPMCMLIADISGYTGYLADVELSTRRTSWPTSSARWSALCDPNFRLAKLEGDAAFTYAPAERIDGSMLLDTDRAVLFRLPSPPPRRPAGDVV